MTEKKKPSSKKVAEGKKSFHTTFDAEVLLELKIQCLRDRVEVNAVLETLAKDWLAERRAAEKK